MGPCIVLPGCSVTRSPSRITWIILSRSSWYDLTVCVDDRGAMNSLSADRAASRRINAVLDSTATWDLDRLAQLALQAVLMILYRAKPNVY